MTPPPRKRTLVRPKVFRRFGPSEKIGNKSFKSSKKYIETLKENNATLVRTVASQKREIVQLRNDVRYHFTRYHNLSMEGRVWKEHVVQAQKLIKDGINHLSNHSNSLVAALDKLASAGTIQTHQQQEQLHPSPSFQEEQLPPSPSEQQPPSPSQQQPPSPSQPQPPSPSEQQPPSPSHPEGMVLNSSSPGLQGNNFLKPTAGAACEIASPSRQGAAKPMVQGHTISKPIVSLQRVHVPLRKGAGRTVQDEGLNRRLSDVLEESSEAGNTSQLFPTQGESGDQNFDEREELECESGSDGYHNDSSSDNTSESEESGFNHQRVKNTYKKCRFSKYPKSAVNATGDEVTSLPQVLLERLQVPSAINLLLTEEDRSPTDLDSDSTKVIFGSFHPVQDRCSPLGAERTSDNVQSNSLPASSWVDDWVDESSSEDDNDGLALQIAESKKSYLEPARQVHLKEGTSWNYDDKGNYRNKPTKKRGSKTNDIKRKSSEFTNPVPQVLEDENVTVLFENNDMSFTQPLPGMFYVHDEQSSIQSRTLLEKPAKNGKRKEAPVHSQLQVSLDRLADNTACRQPSERMMYVTQRNSRERAADQNKSEDNMFNQQESYSLSRKSLNSSALKNSPLKTKRRSVESSLQNSPLSASKTTPPTGRKLSKETSIAKSPQLNGTSSTKSFCDSTNGKRKGVHVLSTSPYRSWVLLERLPSETKRRHQQDVSTPSSSRACNEDKTVQLQRRSLSSPRKSSCSQSAIPTYTPTNLKSPISTNWKRRDLKVPFSPKSSGGTGRGCGGGDDDDDDDDDDVKDEDWSSKTSKRKHKSNITSKRLLKVRVQSKELSKKSSLPSTSGDLRITPTHHVSELTEQNLKSLSSDVCAFTVSDSDLSSTSSDMVGMRPRRMKAPKNLKEPPLNKKMRR